METPSSPLSPLFKIVKMDILLIGDANQELEFEKARQGIMKKLSLSLFQSPLIKIVKISEILVRQGLRLEEIHPLPLQKHVVVLRPYLSCSCAASAQGFCQKDATYPRQSMVERIASDTQVPASWHKLLLPTRLFARLRKMRIAAHSNISDSWHKLILPTRLFPRLCKLRTAAHSHRATGLESV